MPHPQKVSLCFAQMRQDRRREGIGSHTRERTVFRTRDRSHHSQQLTCTVFRQRRDTMPESIHPRVLHLVGIALIFVAAQEQRASVAVMRSLPSGGDIEEHTSSSALEQCHRSQERSPRTAFLQRLNRWMQMLPLRCPAMSKRGFHADAPGPHPAPCFGWLRSTGGAPAAPTRRSCARRERGHTGN